ncbi:methyltransferase [Capnocytophaga cynodegmi]|nr:methyltransferase [Capnocytophaga cynodegmi]
MKNLCNSHKISIFVRALAQHSTAQHSTAQHSTAQHSTAQHINS